MFVQSINIFNGSLNITTVNMDNFFDFSTFGPQELLAMLQSFSAFLGQYQYFNCTWWCAIFLPMLLSFFRIVLPLFLSLDIYRYRQSSAFSLSIPFTDHTLGDLYDFTDAFEKKLILNMTKPAPLALRSSPSLTLVGSPFAEGGDLAKFVGSGMIQLTVDNITATIPYLKKEGGKKKQCCESHNYNRAKYFVQKILV